MATAADPTSGQNHSKTLGVGASGVYNSGPSTVLQTPFSLVICGLM